MPSVESATVTARVISRGLKKAGFTMADTRDRHAWTEGAYVHRIGLSRSVAVDYHFVGVTGARLTERLEIMAKLRKWVIDAGYPLDPEYAGLAVLCKRPD